MMTCLMALERIQKILARAGLGSRRACEDFIVQGRVEVDGRIISELGSKADAEIQEILLDGEPVQAEAFVYYMLYKPRGYICSLRAERGKPRAVDLINDQRRLYTVGRLDEESEGLIVVTNDGELTQKLTHPSFSCPKEYRVTVNGSIDQQALRKLRTGVRLAEGRTSPAQAGKVKEGGGSRSVISLKITEGLNRQVRRMLGSLGMDVHRLVRVGVASLKLGDLRSSKYRKLTETEVKKLLKDAGKIERTEAPTRRKRTPDSRRPVAKMTNKEKRELKRARGKQQAREDRKPRKGRMRSRTKPGSKRDDNKPSKRRGSSAPGKSSSARSGKSRTGSTGARKTASKRGAGPSRKTSRETGGGRK
jgi:23S rRNA pseudouridine2605 synthase